MASSTRSGELTGTVAADQGVVPRPKRASLSSALSVGLAAGLWTITALALLAGVAERAWYVFHHPINSDEAVVGLMAEQILHGHFSALLWGQAYGGAEPYVVAIFIGLFGMNAGALEAAPITLSLLAAVLSWRVACRFVNDKAIAALVGAAVWAGSLPVVANSWIEFGFRAVTLVCGLALLLYALRILDGRRSLWDFGALGLLAGIDWWSSPESAYYLIPAALLLIGLLAARRFDFTSWRSLARVAVSVLGALVGALPWLWDNLMTGFRSLKTRAFSVPPHALNYAGRLRAFFEYSFPMLFDVRKTLTGKWLFGYQASLAVLAILLAVLGVALFLCVMSGGRHLALAIGAVSFPFVLALAPGTWYWKDGRYAAVGYPLLVLVVAAGLAQARRLVPVLGPRRRRDLTRAISCGASALVIALCALGFTTVNLHRTSYFSAWTDPNAAVKRVAHGLEAAGVHTGYADYWVAYDLDFQSGGRLAITTAPGDPDPWPALNRKVLRSPRTAWLFIKDVRLAERQFAQTGHIRGPVGIPEPKFVHELRLLRTDYSTFKSGAVIAVVPRKPVIPSETGLFGSTPSHDEAPPLPS